MKVDDNNPEKTVKLKCPKKVCGGSYMWVKFQEVEKDDIQSTSKGAAFDGAGALSHYHRREGR